MELKTFSTKNFKIDIQEKYNHDKYNLEPHYFITNTINDNTTFVTKETVDELIELLNYIKSL